MGAGKVEISAWEIASGMRTIMLRGFWILEASRLGWLWRRDDCSGHSCMAVMRPLFSTNSLTEADLDRATVGMLRNRLVLKGSAAKGDAMDTALFVFCCVMVVRISDVIPILSLAFIWLLLPR